MTGWDRLPVDEIGYLDTAGLLAKPAPELRAMIDTMNVTRYTGWRNHRGLWREIMGLDELKDKRVLDFGCGVGLEAMQLACRGNRVTVADIDSRNTALARRVCTLYGVTADEMILNASPPVFPKEYPAGSFDVFYASGSLHHSQYPLAVMTEAHRLLRRGGQARLMLYSDRGWRLATGTEPPRGGDAMLAHPEREKFTRFFDPVGDWAEWYDLQRLEQWFGAWFRVVKFAYLTPDDRYCAAILRRIS